MTALPDSDGLDFLDETDRFRLETIDRIYREGMDAGLSEHEIQMQVAAIVPGAFWSIRRRIAPAQFDEICKHYPGVAGVAELIQRFVRSALGDLPKMRTQR
ncbi:MAG: hypothetical protein ACRC67_26110 [Inquilinus sp.]|uniref:hypothetical protein n=1 Tax=Inquilinus sp. TaxID=1932117 RepID=UPI003F3BE420